MPWLYDQRSYPDYWMDGEYNKQKIFWEELSQDQTLETYNILMWYRTLWRKKDITQQYWSDHEKEMLEILQMYGDI